MDIDFDVPALLFAAVVLMAYNFWRRRHHLS